MDDILKFIGSVHPYDSLPRDELSRVAAAFVAREWAEGAKVYRAGETLDGLYLIEGASVEITDPNGELVSILGRANSFGERGLLSARHLHDTEVLLREDATQRAHEPELRHQDVEDLLELSFGERARPPIPSAEGILDARRYVREASAVQERARIGIQRRFAAILAVGEDDDLSVGEGRTPD